MKTFISILICLIFSALPVIAQENKMSEVVEKELIGLIDKYAMARENQDTVLLKSILTLDIDQLVSSGEWRLGLATAVQGMKRSSLVNEGKRTLKVERIKLLNPVTAILDARYTIAPEDGSAPRNMWSTFIAVYEADRWKIAGIRNMLPSEQ